MIAPMTPVKRSMAILRRVGPALLLVASAVALSGCGGPALRHQSATISYRNLRVAVPTPVAPELTAVDNLLETLRPGGRIVLSDDILPSGWFAGPGIMMGNLLRHGHINYRKKILKLLQDKLENVKVTWHHVGLIFILSGIKPA